MRQTNGLPLTLTLSPNSGRGNRWADCYSYFSKSIIPVSNWFCSLGERPGYGSSIRSNDCHGENEIIDAISIPFQPVCASVDVVAHAAHSARVAALSRAVQRLPQFESHQRRRIGLERPQKLRAVI